MNPKAWLCGLALAGLLSLQGCGQPQTDSEVPPSPEETVEATPEPTPEPSPTPEPIDKTAQVTVLGYHRFENPPRDPLAISTEEFRRQMQALKDAGIEVISMDDFLAWRRGEKNIPPRSAIITIDDGYNCTYSQAWPVLQEFGYPFTFYVYTDYISAGGRSIRWEQLEEMRDAGVDIGSHSLSHDNMVRPRRAKDRPYEEWLRDELFESKRILEERLGIPIRTFAYPYGVQNQRVREVGLEAGYEALFTVKGEKLRHDSPAEALGRYVILSDNPDVFRLASNFGTSNVPAAGPASAPATGTAAASSDPGLPTEPAHGSVVSNSLPLLAIDLSSLPNLDAKSLQMRISGLGEVPVTYDAESGRATYQLTQRLRDPSVTVVVNGRRGGNRFETRWNFTYQPMSVEVAPEIIEVEITEEDEDLPPEATQPALP